MREYAKFSPRRWTGTAGQRLAQAVKQKQEGAKDAQILADYLITSPHANMIGLFRLPVGYASADTGLTPDEIELALRTLEDVGYIKYDSETHRIWVVNHFRHEVGDRPVNRDDKRYRAMIRQLDDNKMSPLVEEFVDLYGVDLEEATSVRLSISTAQIPEEVRKAVKSRDGSKCRHCGRTVLWKDRRSDLGGTYDDLDSTIGATADNVVVSCRGCKMNRGSKPTSENGLRPVEEHLDTAQIVSRSFHRSDLDTTRSQDQEQEQEQEQEIPPTVPPPGGRRADAKLRENFERWWQAYPPRRKTNKDKCWSKWKSLHRLKRLPPLEDLLAALERQKRSPDWLKDAGEYIPGPHPYLNGGRWQDEVRAPAQRRELLVSRYDARGNKIEG